MYSDETKLLENYNKLKQDYDYLVKRVKEIESIRPRLIKAEKRLELFEPSKVEQLHFAMLDRVSAIAKVFKSCHTMIIILTELSNFVSTEKNRNICVRNVLRVSDRPAPFWDYLDKLTLEQLEALFLDEAALLELCNRFNEVNNEEQ